MQYFKNIFPPKYHNNKVNKGKKKKEGKLKKMGQIQSKSYTENKKEI